MLVDHFEQFYARFQRLFWNCLITLYYAPIFVCWSTLIFGNHPSSFSTLSLPWFKQAWTQSKAENKRVGKWKWLNIRTQFKVTYVIEYPTKSIYVLKLVPRPDPHGRVSRIAAEDTPHDLEVVDCLALTCLSCGTSLFRGYWFDICQLEQQVLKKEAHLNSQGYWETFDLRGIDKLHICKQYLAC